MCLTLRLRHLLRVSPSLAVVLTCRAELDSVYTRFTSDAIAAFAAQVTEVAFFTAPDGVREEAKTLIEKESIESHPVFTVGKSSGGAIGWGQLSLAMCLTALVFDSLSLTSAQCLTRRTPTTRLRAGSRLLSWESLDTQVLMITSDGGKLQNMPKSSKRWAGQSWVSWVWGMQCCLAETFLCQIRACSM